MRNIVLVYGDRSGVGKDYFTNNFVQALAQQGVSAAAFKIASPLKKLCRRQFNGVLEDHEYEADRSLRELPIEGVAVKNVVDLWIKVGEFYRGLTRYHWVKETASNILKQSKTFSVISDFRFNCEWEYFKELQQEQIFDNIIVVKILAPENIGENKGSDGLVTDSVDTYRLYNDHTPKFLTQIQELALHL